MFLALSHLILFFLSAYCLADLFLSFSFKMRLHPSHVALGLKSGSIWDSARFLIVLFLACCPFLWVFPKLATCLIVFAKWPHPLFTAWKELRQKKLAASFPIGNQKPKGEKLLTVDMSDKPHILFISLESFRAKNVGCLGAKTPLSPHFDKLAQEGILFSNFHAAGNFTSRAIISSLFGVPAAQRPLHLGSYCKSGLLGLPQILKTQGYQSALIQGASLSFDHEAEFFEAQGFHTIWGRKEINKPASSWGVFDEHLMETSVNWLGGQKEPSFLNIYTITNHHPWIHPREKPGYFNTFSYTDESLGLLIDQLKEKNLLEKCVLFIFGDHGQTVEEGIPPFQINQHLYQDNIHVPLLIYAPGRIKEPKVIDTIASQMDLLPTLIDLMDLSEKHHGLGKSLVRASSDPIFFNHPFDLPCIGCREGDWKYLIQDEKEELYNLKDDPEEKLNRIGEGTSLREKTKEYFERVDQFYSGKLQKEVNSLRSLNLGNSLKLDDTALVEKAKQHPDLSILSVNDCLLLTNVGIAQLLHHCPKIEKLYMNGLDEVTGENWKPALDLVQLHANNCPKMKIDWIMNLPNLRVLKLGSAEITDDDLIALAAKQTRLERLQLNNLLAITDRGLKPLLEANPRLNILSLDHCPKVSKEGVDQAGAHIPNRFWTH